MKLPRVHSFSSYNLSESKKRTGLSVNEDEAEDLADDIKGAAPKKTEAPVNSDTDSDIPDDIKTNNTKKTDPGTQTKEKPKTSVTDKYKVNMGLDVSNKSNKSSYSAYTTLFIEALNSLDAMAALGVSVDPEAPAIKNYKTDRYDIATSVDKTAEGLKKAWNKIYSIAGTWPPSGKGITGIIQANLKSNDVYKKYFEEKKKLDAELNGTPKMKQEVYNTQLADLKKKYSDMIDPKQIMALGKINNAIGLYRTAIDKFRQGADVELGFVEKREGGIKGEDLVKVEALQKTIEDDKIPKQDRISAAEKLKKDFPAYFGNIKTGDIINGAIDQIKSGLSEAPENFYEELSDAISSIVLAKKPDEKKEESENWIGPQERILEDFGGFLNANKAFATGVGKGIVDGFKGGPKDKSVKGGEDKASLLYAADAIKGSLVGLASEIDNVVAFKKNIHGLSNNSSGDSEGEKLTRKSSDLTAEEAKAEAAEMISFVKDSFKYVTNVSKELESSSVTPASIKKKLDDISHQIEIIGRKGGTLEKWKNDVLGESRERVASTAYLEKGRALMQMAAAKAAEVTNQQAIEKRYRDRDADVVIKKAVDSVSNMISGNGEGTGLKPSKIKKKGDVTVFSKDDKNANKEVIKTFQQRLIDLGHLPTGNLNGEFDEETKNASKIAMTYLGTLSGKVYADNAEAFQDFQRDLGFYNDNKDEIKKKMGL